MKRKINLSIPLILILVIAQCASLCSCATNQEGKTPTEIIEDFYGNEEFKISFSSETLDTPLEDMTYSSKITPELPTPVKVGYIFDGWFFDSDFIVPYNDDMLRLSMKDIVLYPKWIKETFIHNGTYDIEFDAKIVEGTVKKGPSTEKFGGFKDFCDIIDKEACHIEKSEDELLLKLQYDCGVFTPFEGVGVINDAFTVNMVDTDITVKNVINSQAETVRTMFLKIDKWNLTDTLYLDIVWENYENPEVTSEIRKETATTYRVAIDLTKIIGFSESFQDTSVPLEKGYYIAKSYYRKEDNLQSMAKTFNPVYSYLYSDGDGHYKLIKQNTPYVGLVANRHPLYTPITDNYYDTMMAFTAVMTIFDIDGIETDEQILSPDGYYPSIYNGGKYRTTTTEFHADTGKFYNVFDIDSDLTKEYIALTAVSGYMERNAGMGYVRQILSIDYKNLIKIPDCDYKPLEGDFFEYEDEFNFYPGNYSDLDERNLTYDALMNFGFSIEMPNFYYSAPEINSSLPLRKMHSSKVVVTPKKKTAGFNVADSKYMIAEFDMNAKIYGYDAREGNNLYIDRMSTQAFAGGKDRDGNLQGGYNSQLRDKRLLKCGQSVKVGDIIELEKLFKEKVSRTTDFANVIYSAYEINDGKIDFSKSVFIKDKKIDFTRDVAVEFKYEEDGNIVKTVVELKEAENPTVKIESGWYVDDSGHYQKSQSIKVGDKIRYPELYYKWGDVRYDILDNFYENSEGDVSINPARCVIFANHGSGYRNLILPTSHNDVFEISDKFITVIYELRNEFNERKYVSFDFNSSAKRTYTITNEFGEVIEFEDVKFTEEGYRKSIFCTHTCGSVFDKFTADNFVKYYHKENGRVENYQLSYFNIHTNNGELKYQPSDTVENMLKVINDFLKDKVYGCVSFVYGHSAYGDALEINYLYKINYNGLDTYEALNFDNYFTNTVYSFVKLRLIGSNMKPLAKNSLTVSKIVDGRKVDNYQNMHYSVDDEDGRSEQYKIIFKTPGTYRLEMNYYVPSYMLSNSISRSKHITFRQTVEVDSNMCDVEVTFVTDKRHPFKNGSLEKTVTYSLTDGVKLLTGDRNVFDKSKFELDRRADSLSKWSTTPNNHGELYRPGTMITGKDFIDKYNSKHIRLYALWEIRFRVTCIISDLVEPQTVIATLNSDGDGYHIQFPQIQDRWVPENMKFQGWTGGMLGGRVLEENYMDVPYREDYYDTEKYKDDFTFRAKWLEYKQVKFEIDRTIAEPKRTRKVLEGERMENTDYLMDMTMRDNNYRFVGYYVEGDASQQIVDLKTFVITDNITFVAKFVKR